MKPSPTIIKVGRGVKSTTITRARAIATKKGWSAKAVQTEIDALSVIDHGCYFDQGAADHVVRFFVEFLHHSTGEWAGRPFALMPWQKDELIDKHSINEDDGRAWYGGLDLGGSSDVSAWALLSRCPHDPEAVDVRCRFWLPEATLSSKHPNAGLYRQWAKAGHLVTTPAPTGERTPYRGDKPLDEWLEKRGETRRGG